MLILLYLDIKVYITEFSIIKVSIFVKIYYIEFSALTLYKKDKIHIF